MFISLFVGVLVLIFILAFVASHFMTRDWFGERVAQRQTLLLAGLLLSIAFIGIAVYLLVPVRWREPLWTMYLLGFAILCFSMIARSVRRRHHAEPLLLDLGPLPGHYFFLITSGVYMFMALNTMFFDMLLDHNFSLQTWAELVFRLALASLFVFMGRTRVQLLDGGLLHQQLIPWQKIRAYHWEADHSTTLTLQVKSWLPFTAERNILVPVQYRDLVQHILTQRLVSDFRQPPTSS